MDQRKVIWISWVQDVDRRPVISGHIGAAAAAERSVITFGKSDWESCSEARDSRDCPSTEQLALHTMTRLCKGQIVAVAHDKVVRDIKRRESPTQFGIEWVDRIEESGRVVNGFRPGVCAEYAKSSHVPLELYLQSVVI